MNKMHFFINKDKIERQNSIMDFLGYSLVNKKYKNDDVKLTYEKTKLIDFKYDNIEKDYIKCQQLPAWPSFAMVGLTFVFLTILLIVFLSDKSSFNNSYYLYFGLPAMICFVFSAVYFGIKTKRLTNMMNEQSRIENQILCLIEEEKMKEKYGNNNR